MLEARIAFTSGSCVATTLRGHKFVRKDDKFERVQIFELEREIAVKRRSHYA